MPQELATLSWVDWLLAGVLLLSALVGLWRGIILEVMSLAGWLVAFLAAQFLAGDAARYIPVGTPGSALNHGVAFAAVFLATLIVWGLLSRLVSALVKATPLSVPDRILGAVFGVARAGVLLLALATVVAMTPLGKSATWQQSVGARGLGVLLQGIKPYLPLQVQPHLPER